MQIQLFIPIIIDEIRFDPDDIIEVENEMGSQLISHEAAQDIENGILSIEEIRSKKPNFVKLDEIFKIPKDLDFTTLLD